MVRHKPRPLYSWIKSAQYPLNRLSGQQSLPACCGEENPLQLWASEVRSLLHAWDTHVLPVYCLASSGCSGVLDRTSREGILSDKTIVTRWSKTRATFLHWLLHFLLITQIILQRKVEGYNQLVEFIILKCRFVKKKTVFLELESCLVHSACMINLFPRKLRCFCFLRGTEYSDISSLRNEATSSCKWPWKSTEVFIKMR